MRVACPSPKGRVSLKDSDQTPTLTCCIRTVRRQAAARQAVTDAGGGSRPTPGPIRTGTVARLSPHTRTVFPPRSSVVQRSLSVPLASAAQPWCYRPSSLSPPPLTPIPDSKAPSGPCGRFSAHQALESEARSSLCTCPFRIALVFWDELYQDIPECSYRVLLGHCKVEIKEIS